MLTTMSKAKKLTYSATDPKSKMVWEYVKSLEHAPAKRRFANGKG